MPKTRIALGAPNVVGDAWNDACNDAWGPARGPRKRCLGACELLGEDCLGPSATPPPRVLGNARNSAPGHARPSSKLLRGAWTGSREGRAAYPPRPGFFSKTLLLQGAIRELVSVQNPDSEARRGAQSAPKRRTATSARPPGTMRGALETSQATPAGASFATRVAL